MLSLFPDALRRAVHQVVPFQEKRQRQHIFLVMLCSSAGAGWAMLLLSVPVGFRTEAIAPFAVTGKVSRGAGSSHQGKRPGEGNPATGTARSELPAEAAVGGGYGTVWGDSVHSPCHRLDLCWSLNVPIARLFCFHWGSWSCGSLS